MTELSEKTLREHVKAVQDGDRNAFGPIYDQYFLQVYRYYVSRVKRDEEAEELTSEAFFKALRGIESYRPEGNIPFSAWLFRIVKNLLIDHYRKQREHSELTDDMPFADQNMDSSRQANQHFSREMLNSALEELPQMQAQAISLRFFSELSNSEIALVLDKSETAVRILLSRGLKRLAVVMESAGFGDDLLDRR